MNCWLDLYKGTTWDEFQKAGSKVTGFSSRMRNAVNSIEKGDILLRYLTGVMRWVGALRVLGPSQDKRPIWHNADFPVRVEATGWERAALPSCLTTHSLSSRRR